jgi:tyrosine-protein kinase Etk/Wzc
MISNIPTTPTTSVRSQDVSLFDYLAVILRRRATFALAFFAVFIVVALYTFLMKPIYEASSTLHIKDDNGKGNLLGELSLKTTNPINAEIEILKSRTNAEQVVRRLHLNWNISKKSDGLTFKLLEFTSTAKKPVYRIELTAADSFKVEDDDGELVGQGKAGVLMQGKGVSLLLNDLKGQTGDSFLLSLAPFDDTVKGLQGGIKAAEQGRETSIIRVSYNSTNPILARDIVNNLVQAYLEQSVAFKSEEAGRAVGFVEEQLQGLRGELDIAEKNLQVYKSASGVIKLDSEAQAIIDKLSEKEKARTEVVLQRKQLEFARDALKEAMRKGTIYSPGIMMNDPGLAAKLSELEVQKRALLTDYTEAYPAVKALKGQIEEVQKKILSTYETSTANLAKQQDTVAQQLASYEKQMQKLPMAERDLARLTRISKVSADIYTFLLQKHEEARIAKASTISNINIVDPAIAADWPIKPKKLQYLLLGLIIGLALGVGLAFFQEYLDDTIKNADEAKRVMGLPLLAVIPHIPGYEPKTNIPQKVMPITQLEPKSVVSEAFRALRTSLHFSVINREKKIMLVTSTFPREGKSIISSNLACILSQTGARVLLVDCDLRRSSLHEKFGHSKTPGLSEILTGDVTFAEAKHNTVISGLDLISAGTNPPNPSELLGSEAMRLFLLTQRENYDHIVIDAPPVLAVSDAPVLTAISDLVVLVMEAGRVPIKVAKHMRETLSALHVPIAGLVLNDKTGKGESYGYYGGRYYRHGKGKRYGNGYGYGYGYGYYSDDEQTKPRKKIVFWEKIPFLEKIVFWKRFLPSRKHRHR